MKNAIVLMILDDARSQMRLGIETTMTSGHTVPLATNPDRADERLSGDPAGMSLNPGKFQLRLA